MTILEVKTPGLLLEKNYVSWPGVALSGVSFLKCSLVAVTICSVSEPVPVKEEAWPF